MTTEICTECWEPIEIGETGGYCDSCGFPVCTDCSHLHSDSDCSERFQPDPEEH